MNKGLMKVPKPNFFIIGSAKCGTTTLADLLATHPDCCFSQPKEVAFFSHNVNYNQGWEWYQKAFDHYNGEKMIGEATPNYSHMPMVPNCAERIFEFNPEAKIVFIVRHPYKRLVSEWQMDHYHGMFPELHNEALKGFESYMKFRQQRDQVFEASKFDYQLSAYTRLFPMQNIKVFFLEEWIQNPAYQAERLCEFLCLDFELIRNFSTHGSNRADTRMQLSTFGKWLVEVNRKLGISRVLKINRSLLDKLIRQKAVTPQPIISQEYKKYIIDYLKEDARLFLGRFERPEKFWDFSNL